MIRSMRGKSVDMVRLIAQNGNKTAINGRPRTMANMNARGDLLAGGGTVLLPRDQMVREYNRSNPRAVKQVALRDISTEVLCSDTPEQAVTKQRSEIAQKKSRRKIID